MVTVSALPREVLFHIFSLLPHRDLVSAGRTCKHWHGLSKDELLLQRVANIWLEAKYFPSNDDMDLAVFLGIMSFKFEILEYYGKYVFFVFGLICGFCIACVVVVLVFLAVMVMALMYIYHLVSTFWF